MNYKPINELTPKDFDFTGDEEMKIKESRLKKLEEQFEPVRDNFDISRFSDYELDRITEKDAKKRGYVPGENWKERVARRKTKPDYKKRRTGNSFGGVSLKGWSEQQLEDFNEQALKSYGFIKEGGS